MTKPLAWTPSARDRHLDAPTMQHLTEMAADLADTERRWLDGPPVGAELAAKRATCLKNLRRSFRRMVSLARKKARLRIELDNWPTRRPDAELAAEKAAKQLTAERVAAKWLAFLSPNAVAAREPPLTPGTGRRISLAKRLLACWPPAATFYMVRRASVA